MPSVVRLRADHAAASLATQRPSILRMRAADAEAISHEGQVDQRPSELVTSNLVAMAEIRVRTSLSRSTIYRLMQRDEFPRPVQISPGRVAWREVDLADWLSRR